jgi:DNA-binding transcriptional LysR family regulator
MNLSSLDLNLLVVLHTVLEQKSVARAAAKLHVTPPAVSNALSRLRDVIGDPLLVRRGRGLVATPRALELAPRVALALRELEHALGSESRFDPTRTRRRFVLACSDNDQTANVPRLAAAFGRAMPSAQLHVVSIDQLTASDGLAAGTVDAAVVPAGAYPEDLHAQPLYSDEAAFVLRAGHPVRAARLSRAQFNALRHVDIWLVLGRAGVGNQQVQAFLRRHGLVRDVAVIVPGFMAAAQVVTTTDLIAGMPRRVAEALARHLPLRIARPPTASMRIDLKLVWHERTHEDPGAVMFRSLVVETFRRTRRTAR